MHDPHYFPYEFIAVPVVMAVLAVLFWWRSYRLRKQSYEWYKKTYPQFVLDGRVKCHHCNSTRIGTERLMQHTYLRRHVCQQCGNTLYYSSER